MSHDNLVQKKLMQADVEQLERRLQSEYLGKVANATAASLDVLCFHPSDRLNVLLHLFTSLSVASGGSREQVLKLVTEAYEEQKAVHDRMKAGKPMPAVVTPH